MSLKVILVLAVLVTIPIHAALIDFEGLTASSNFSGAPAPASVLTNQFASVGVMFGQTGVSTGVAVVDNSGGFAPSSGVNSIVGLDNAGQIPPVSIGDIYFFFVTPNTTTLSTTNLVTFTIGDGGGDLDVFQIRSYDLSNALINTQNLSGISRFPVTISVANINRVEVDFTGSFGYSLDDLGFNTPGGASVPEPGTLSLLVPGAFALWFAKRKLRIGA